MPYLSGFERHLPMTLNPDSRTGDASGAGIAASRPRASPRDSHLREFRHASTTS